jgi:hypothetical protein
VDRLGESSFLPSDGQEETQKETEDAEYTEKNEEHTGKIYDPLLSLSMIFYEVFR